MRSHGDEAKLESFLSKRVEQELVRDPICIQQQPARDAVTSHVLVEARTKPQRVPKVDVYASTVTDARLLGCLEAQLAPLIQQALGRPKETKRYRLFAVITSLPDDSAGEK